MQISINAVDSNSIQDLKAKDEDSMFVPPRIMWIIADVGDQSPACNYH